MRELAVTARPITRLASRQPGVLGSLEAEAIVTLLRSNDVALRAHARLATPAEAVRTNCPSTWPCVVVDATLTQEQLASLRALVCAFEEGVAFARRSGT